MQPNSTSSLCVVLSPQQALAGSGVGLPGRGWSVTAGGREGPGLDRHLALQKAESEELEVQKPQVKLRRAVSEVVRPASTPPIMASAIKDEDDEERIIAELEVGQT